MLRWHYFLPRKGTNDDLGGGLLHIHVYKNINQMTLHSENAQTCKAIESNLPSFIVKLCNYCSTFSVSPKQLWKLEETWWFSILLAETKTNMGLQKRQTAHERTNHTIERNQTKAGFVKPDSPACLGSDCFYFLFAWLIGLLVTIQTGIVMIWRCIFHIFKEFQKIVHHCIDY